MLPGVKFILKVIWQYEKYQPSCCSSTTWQG